MRITHIDLSKPLEIRVGEVTIHIFKCGEKRAKLGVDAPDDIAIQMQPASAEIGPQITLPDPH